MAGTSEIARHTATYGLGFVVGGVARLVLIPILAQTLTKDQYGVYSLLIAASAFLQSIFDLGFVEAMIRFHHSHPENEERRKLRAMLFRVMPILDGAIAIPLFFARDLLSMWMFGTTEYGSLVAITIAIAFFGANFQLVVAQLRAQDRSRDFVLLMIAKGVGSLAVSLVLVFQLDMGVEGFLIGQLAGPAAVAVVAVPLQLVRSGPGLENLRERLSPIFQFGFPLVPAALGMWALSFLDAYLLRSLADLESVGVYRFAAEVCLPLSLLLSSLHFAWPSFAFARARESDGDQRIARVSRHLFVLLAWLCLAIAVLRNEILVVIGAERFLESAKLIPLWVLATFLYGVWLVFTTGLQIARNTRRLPLLVAGAVAVNVLLNLFLIPRAGVFGCAVAKVATFLILVWLVLRESNRLHPIPFEISKILALVVAGGLFLWGTDSLGETNLTTGIALRGAALLLFPLVLVPLRALSMWELLRIPGFLKELWSRR